jgi:hypothetical protein
MTASKTNAAAASRNGAPETLAFTRDHTTATAAEILNNVVPVLDMLAAVFDETDQTVHLPPMAAKGLHKILDATRHDVAIALEMAEIEPGPPGTA